MKNGHENIREMLALAAAGALDDTEARRVEEHAANCTDCAAELERWQNLAGALRRVPTPQPSPQLLARVRAQAEWKLAAKAAHREDAGVLVFLCLLSWTMVLATWPMVRLVGADVISWLEVAHGSIGLWLSGYTLVGCLAAGLALLFGLRKQGARRAT